MENTLACTNINADTWAIIYTNKLICTDSSTHTCTDVMSMYTLVKAC